MVEDSLAGGASEGASRATYGIAVATSGGVAVALGLLLAPELPAVGAFLVGVPAGIAAWLLVREALDRAVGREEDAARECCGPPSSGTTAGAGGDP